MVICMWFANSEFGKSDSRWFAILSVYTNRLSFVVVWIISIHYSQSHMCNSRIFIQCARNWWTNLRRIWLKNFRQIKKNSCHKFWKFLDYTKIVKNYKELRKILIERIWKKIEINSFREIFKNFEKRFKKTEIFCIIFK